MTANVFVDRFLWSLDEYLPLVLNFAVVFTVVCIGCAIRWCYRQARKVGK